MELAIFGAQAIALGAYEAIHNLCPARRVRCFLVTKRGRNSASLSGVPVMELEPFSKALTEEEKGDIQILIATPENLMPGIEESLDAHGLGCHVRLTSPRWSELMRYHYLCGKRFLPLCVLPVGFHRANVHIFMAKSHKDKPLAEAYGLPEWIVPVQVGAALCDVRIAEAADCDGENISVKNGNYSELTALYWMWKNRLVPSQAKSGDAYYGLVHYRRILEFTEDDFSRLIDNGVDVVLPFPMPYEPDIEEHHKKYLRDEDWTAVVKAVQEIRPEYAGKFSDILRQKFFYNYNIMLARREVLVEYCEWLFPILECVEELSIPKGAERSDRYLGYAGETLATLYFMDRKDELNILHTGCRFLM